MRRNVQLLIAIAAFIADVILLVVLHALSDAGSPGSSALHTVLLAVAVASSTAWLLAGLFASEDTQPMQLVSRIVVVVTMFLLLIGILQFAMTVEFQTVDGVIAPDGYSSLVGAGMLACAGLAVALLVFIWISVLLFIKRRRQTRRNFTAFLALFAIAVLLQYISSPNGLGVESADPFATLFHALTVLAMLFNVFRFSWILTLSRREKLLNLVLMLFGSMFFIILSVYTSGDDTLYNALQWYHPLAYGLVSIIFEFGAVYMGVGFASTLLHLPTAKEFDRKKAEISSLQNLSRLITQVFDFNELAATATHLALEVTEGSAAWLEVVPRDGKQKHTPSSGRSDCVILPASVRNINTERIEDLRLADGSPLRALAFETDKPVLIQDFTTDRRIHPNARQGNGIGSLVIVPLSSHGGTIGLLCVTKRNPYEFDRDVITILYAFADMVSVAMENSRLIRESIVKERMEQELLVAQQMQQSLLPQSLPSSPRYDIAARSIPAYEVGGDYYDVQDVGPSKLGMVVGDVSGKGVSAALYMAQLKGMFQTYSAGASDAGDLLRRLNETLCRSMDRRSFISLLYAMLDTEHGELRFARAGHCPLLYIHEGEARYLQPPGIALGLDAGERFAEALQEERLPLHSGDIVVLYTDGITEARNAVDEQFETERLADVVLRNASTSAGGILDAVVSAVHDFSGRSTADDDMTILVVRWK